MKKLNMREYMKKMDEQIQRDVKKYEDYLANATPEQKQKFKEQLDLYGFSDNLGD